MSRQADRSGLDAEVRVRMLEDDMDRAEDQNLHTKNTARSLVEALRYEINEKLVTIREGLMREVEEARSEAKEARDESAGQRKILVGILVSVTSLAIGIVVQVLAFRGGS